MHSSKRIAQALVDGDLSLARTLAFRVIQDASRRNKILSASDLLNVGSAFGDFYCEPIQPSLGEYFRAPDQSSAASLGISGIAQIVYRRPASAREFLNAAGATRDDVTRYLLAPQIAHALIQTGGHGHALAVLEEARDLAHKRQFDEFNILQALNAVDEFFGRSSDALERSEDYEDSFLTSGDNQRNEYIQKTFFGLELRSGKLNNAASHLERALDLSARTLCGPPFDTTDARVTMDQAYLHYRLGDRDLARDFANTAVAQINTNLQPLAPLEIFALPALLLTADAKKTKTAVNHALSALKPQGDSSYENFVAPVQLGEPAHALAEASEAYAIVKVGDNAAASERVHDRWPVGVQATLRDDVERDAAPDRTNSHVNLFARLANAARGSSPENESDAIDELLTTVDILDGNPALIWRRR